MRAVAALLALVVGVGLAAPADAEHEVYYRYTVLGYVMDGRGFPLAGRSVELVREKTGLSYTGATDDSGLYVLVARLGDETLGETLRLTIGDLRTQLTVRFDTANHADERGTRVDLDGARLRERPALFRSTLSRVLAPGR